MIFADFRSVQQKLSSVASKRFLKKATSTMESEPSLSGI